MSEPDACQDHLYEHQDWQVEQRLEKTLLCHQLQESSQHEHYEIHTDKGKDAEWLWRVYWRQKDK